MDKRQKTQNQKQKQQQQQQQQQTRSQKKHNRKAIKTTSHEIPNNGNVIPEETNKIIKTLSQPIRYKVRDCVAEILKLVFIEPSNANAEWQQYVTLQKLLKRIMDLEAPLKQNLTLYQIKNRVSNVGAFYKWCQNNGVKYDGVCIKNFPGYDLGLAATKDIKKHDLLFTIPQQLIMSEENLKQHKLHKLSNLNLAFLLMTEALDAQSFWKPYIDLLPTNYNTVLYYDIDDMAQLKGSNCLSAALKQCRLIARCYATLHHWPESALPCVTFKDIFHYDLYRWAVSTVMTRENLIPRTKCPSNDDNNNELMAALIPFWDMANHSNGHITSFLNMETLQMESVAQDDFQKDEQIFIHYGNRTNAEFLIHNGFINLNNPNDCVAIKLGLSQSDNLYEKRSQLLELLNIPKNGELKVLPPPTHISSELLAFVRVFNMNEEQLEHWIKSDRATDLMHIDCALETYLESKTWQYLQTRLMLLLRAFPTTLEADEKQLNDLKADLIQMTQRRAIILEYRVLEKRILAAALEYAKQRTKV